MDLNSVFGFEFSVPILVGFKYWVVEFAQDGHKISVSNQN